MGWRDYISGLKDRKTGRERRKHQRIRTSLSVISGSTGPGERRHVLLDVSRGGGLLSPNLDLSEQTETMLRLEGGKSASVTVVRQSAAGTAIMFDDSTDATGLIADLVNLARIAGPCHPEPH